MKLRLNSIRQFHWQWHGVAQILLAGALLSSVLAAPAWAVWDLPQLLLPPTLIDAESLMGLAVDERHAPSWFVQGLLPLAAIPAWLIWLRRHRPVNKLTDPGFEVISPSERRRYIPLKEKFLQLDFLTSIQFDNTLRLSANLNRVSLSIRRYGYLLEDKNFRNALLVNRRRIRRTLLKDGDVLDLGDLTLLYRDPRPGPGHGAPALTPQDGKTIIKFRRVRGPVRKGTPYLLSEQFPNRVFYITKNVVYVGRSEDNDLVVKASGVQYRHAKIERIGSRYKLVDLAMTGDTFVNNRRVEQRYLKEGDLISIDKERFKYLVAAKAVRDRQFPGESGYGATPDDAADTAYVEEAPAV
jgi:pSer/pThr/pTyr-binding forkhead associated (FHA) protein